MRSRRREHFAGRALLSGLVSGLALMFSAGVAHAEPTAADKETARRLMAEGRGHRKAGDARGALQSFLAADAIMHVPTTGLEVAKSEIAVGQLVEARDRLLAVVRLPVEDNEPTAFGEARAAAEPLAAAIEPRIPSITLKLNGIQPGFEAKVKVTVDGVPVPAAALALPRAVDPGHHVVTAKQGAGDPGQAEVDVAEREAKVVPIDVPPDLTPPPEQHEIATGPALPPPRQDTGTWRIVTFGGFGLGAAGIILGSVTGILAISDVSSAKKAGCIGSQCGPAADPDLNSASTMATLSTVGFIAGGVGVVGGGVGALMWRRADQGNQESPAPTPPASESPPPPAAALHLTVGPGSLFLAGTF